eukprot:3807077-Rhodomonas_salina.1
MRCHILTHDVTLPGDGAAQQPPRSPWPMISIAEANRISLELTEPMKPVEKPIGELEGCILAQDVIAPEPVPTVPTSIMDGYAVVSSDGAGYARRSPPASPAPAADAWS